MLTVTNMVTMWNFEVIYDKLKVMGAGINKNCSHKHEKLKWLTSGYMVLSLSYNIVRTDTNQLHNIPIDFA